MISTGCCILRSTETKLSNTIDWFTDCEYSHSGFIVKINNVLYVFEFDKFGGQFIEWETYNRLYTDIIVLRPSLSFSIEEKRMAIKECLNLTQYRYDYENLAFHQVIRCLSIKAINWLRGKGFKIKKDYIWIGRNGASADKAFNCGEATIELYYRVRGWFEDIAYEGSGSPDYLYKSTYFQHLKLNEI